MIEAGYERWSHFTKNEVNWRKASNSLIWNNIPYFRPIADPDNFLINVAVLKCHFTGLTTLAVKNLQGCVPRGYGQFCTAWEALEPYAERAGIDFPKGYHQDFQKRIEAEFIKHRAAGFKRWDYDGAYKRYEEKGGWAAYSKAKKNPGSLEEFTSDISGLMRHEMWIHSGLDNAAVLKPDINIILGIIGLDGDEHNSNKIGDDQLCNMVIAGISPFEVDAVGSYFMGHDPREIWYTRVAKEKGYGECDPEKIKIYWIRNKEIIPLKSLSEIKRHPLGINWSRLKDPNERLFW